MQSISRCVLGSLNHEVTTSLVENGELLARWPEHHIEIDFQKYGEFTWRHRKKIFKTDSLKYFRCKIGSFTYRRRCCLCVKDCICLYDSTPNTARVQSFSSFQRRRASVTFLLWFALFPLTSFTLTNIFYAFAEVRKHKFRQRISFTCTVTFP